MNNEYYYDNYRLVEFYDDMYRYEDDFDLWSEFIKPGMRILEVACGTGRLTKLLLEKCNEIHVDALDYSQEMLGILSHKLEQFNIKQSNSVEIINADMRYYETEEKYDVIIIPSNSLNHIETNEDMEKTLKRMYSLLKKGGVLLFDVLNPLFKFLIRDEDKKYDETVYKKAEEDRYFCTYEKSKYDYASQINKVEYTYFYCDTNGVKLDDTNEYKMTINVRLYFPQEMDYYIELSPFKNYVKYGWYDKRPFKGDTPEQIYVLYR